MTDFLRTQSREQAASDQIRQMRDDFMSDYGRADVHGATEENLVRLSARVEMADMALMAVRDRNLTPVEALKRLQRPDAVFDDFFFG